MTKETLIQMYFDYKNNDLTIDQIAETLNLDVEDVLDLISDLRIEIEDKMKEINDKIMQKCSFVTLESIDQSGFCFDLRVDNIIFGPWGIENAYDRSITEGEMPLGELRDMGMTEDQEIQLMQEINDAMSICEDLTS